MFYLTIELSDTQLLCVRFLQWFLVTNEQTYLDNNSGIDFTDSSKYILFINLRSIPFINLFFDDMYLNYVHFRNCMWLLFSVFLNSFEVTLNVSLFNTLECTLDFHLFYKYRCIYFNLFLIIKCLINHTFIYNISL